MTPEAKAFGNLLFKFLLDLNEGLVEPARSTADETAGRLAELTKVIERRDEAWVRGFLQNPQGFYPGRRKMVQYDFTDQEITDLVAFLTWIGTVDTNGFPFDPPLREASQRAIRQEELRREREGK